MKAILPQTVHSPFPRARHVFVRIEYKIPSNRRLRHHLSKEVNFCVRLVMLFVGLPIVGAQFRMDAPNPPTQCVPSEFTWSGGIAPYVLTIAPGDSLPSTWPQYSGLTRDSFIWSTNVPAGTDVNLALKDSTGEVQNESFTVQSGSDDSCLSSAGVTTPNAPSTTTSRSSTQFWNSEATLPGTSHSGVQSRSQSDVSTGLVAGPTITVISHRGSKGNSLPAAALGGIGAGAIVFVVLVAVLIFWFRRSRKASVWGRSSKTPNSEVYHRDEDSTGQRRPIPPFDQAVPTGRHTYVANRPGSSAPAMPAQDSDFIIEASQYGEDRRSSVMVELSSSGRGLDISRGEGPLHTDPVNLPPKYAELRAEAEDRRRNEAQRDRMEPPRSERESDRGTTLPQYDTEDVMSDSTPSTAPPAYSM
ncbi:hypothetical protein BD311DRAFT_311342 [Dichomitus squalens]|uniref:Uncharacterized protein n=1 Tax=Dichomitus squalens TaxID=114155 RepID=A0A4V2K0G9_9APHY|nr:hypothetical protein BD311DRAFT_311342 [Dichomitus squalens]